MTQPAPNVFGYDLSCVNDLDPGMAEVGGITVLAQALARRLITPRGQLIDDPNYGYDLNGFLNDDIDPIQDPPRIAAGIDLELQKDERVFSSTSQVTFATNVITTTTQVLSALGPFTFVLAVSNVTAQLLAVTPS
jgi:hypothetical protein